ncbi:nucleotidyltransferase family protein [Georgenia sp. Z1344]|uniref:nucleotidyltransferase family protein n=1 Tax=Georgenia sp. Z1344 TaxID=3416706 RepID=UPI003CF4357E
MVTSRAHDPGPTVGMLLAAGAGRRYGMPKILVPGWLAHGVDALRVGGCDEVLVVTGAARPELPDGAAKVHCPGWERGIGASLRAGLDAVPAGTRRMAIHLVDYPDIGPDVVARVLAAADDDLVRASFAGRARHPVVVPAAHLGPLLAELTDDDGAAPYLRTQEVRLVECGDLAGGEDVDTPR